ncbi:hypothetical protein QTL95_02775 [Rhizobium sp. S152]|uniref:hypothetical protein n=1 Tax=Rhizobium sp. S152 TaxID=3055038 RepID=UPI0025A9CC54|nr:hypothetical protein [Rhizobium sp. S152]MDM9624804.1 hypothetical protein [Rhizobium sp. S152]
MTIFENDNSTHCDAIRFSADTEQSGSAGRAYAERVTANRPTIAERFIIVAALLLLSAAGVMAHFAGPAGSSIDNATVGSVSETVGSASFMPADLDFCREHSPYADRSC